MCNPYCCLNYQFNENCLARILEANQNILAEFANNYEYNY